MELDGAVTEEPVCAARGLLQGCPASPLLLAGIMACWSHKVKQDSENVHIGSYLDDRTLWATGDDAADTIANAIAAGKIVDDEFKMVET